MITELKLTNFRSVTSATMSFDAGLVVIRAPSEAGKSTRLHAIKYALWGAKSLKQPLAEVVTWGLPEGALKVELTLEMRGRQYLFTRSKAGASVFIDGDFEPYVTGQTEVTEFATQLVGADANTAERLMFSSQGKITGALEAGGKATSQMIEDLADFTLFEELLEKMGKHLALGSDVGVKDRLAKAQQALEACEVQAPDTRQLQAKAEEYEELATLKDKELATLQEEAASAASRLTQAKAIESAYTAHVAKVKALESKLEAAKVVLSTTKDLANVPSLEDEINDTMSKIESQKTLTKALEAHKAFKALAEPEYEWEGDEESFLLAKESAANNLSEAKAKEYEIKSRVKMLTSSKVSVMEKCPTCGQKISDAEQLAKHNKELDAKIEQAKVEFSLLAPKIEQLQDEMDAYATIDKEIRVRSSFLQNFSEFVEVNLKFSPVRLTWKGAIPEGGLEQGLVSRLKELQQEESERVAAQAKVGLLQGQCDEMEADLKALIAQEQVTPMPATELERDVQNLQALVAKAKDEMGQALKAAYQCRVEIQSLNSAYEYSLKRKDEIKEQVEQAQADLDLLSFNNGLVKKIRACRPVVSDKLWGMILGAVSASFSKMRGVKTVITKTKDGFLANGQSVESLSGSTMDLLGLAIRCALLKTFIPDCPFLILDEPMAQCSDDRAAQMLAYIRSCDFPQIILVTHEEVSSDQADQLIVLE